MEAIGVMVGGLFRLATDTGDEDVVQGRMGRRAVNEA